MNVPSALEAAPPIERADPAQACELPDEVRASFEYLTLVNETNQAIAAARDLATLQEEPAGSDEVLRRHAPGGSVQQARAQARQTLLVRMKTRSLALSALLSAVGWLSLSEPARRALLCHLSELERILCGHLDRVPKDRST